jgi:hypothetical protein
VTVADLEIIAGLVFARGTLPARLERFDVTAAAVFAAAGVPLTHGPPTPPGTTPSQKVVKALAEVTLAGPVRAAWRRSSSGSSRWRAWPRPRRNRRSP